MLPDRIHPDTGLDQGEGPDAVHGHLFVGVMGVLTDEFHVPFPLGFLDVFDREDWKRICREVRVIEPRFQLDEGGRLRTAVVYTKMCRGEMTRQLLCGRATDPEALRDFTWEGFRFDEARSTPNSPLFTM